ncbi:MAG: helix-turn-helix transcriptional regulator [Paludibacter sp.]|nr:helix-turn-helix transcriptional regulator [Paludibacter sp.]
MPEKGVVKSKLLTARLQKGVSQEQLADLIGMGQSSYSRREKGLVPIMEHEWIRIAKELNIKRDTIFEESKSPSNLNKENHFDEFTDYIMETMRKYIEILETENQLLKDKLNNKSN